MIYLLKLDFALFFLIALGMLFIPERLILSKLYEAGLLGLKITGTVFSAAIVIVFFFCS